MTKVLFICQANIIRSPMAEGALKALLKEGNYQGEWQTASAGTWTRGGKKIHPVAEQILADEGVELADHRSQEVTAALVEQADVVLTMEKGQKEALQAEFSEQAGKIYMLSEVEGKLLNVIDPVGEDELVFRTVYEEILGHLQDHEDRLREMAAGE